MTAQARAARARSLQAVVARVDPPDRARLDARMEKAAHACGCSTGAVALFATLAAETVWIAARGRFGLWPETAAAALVVVGSAALGKLAGLAAADAWLWWVGRRFRFSASGGGAGEQVA